MYKLSNQFSKFIQYYSTTEYPSKYIIEIANSIIENNFSLNFFNIILKKHTISNIKDKKNESLDFLLSYANFILIDNIILENEIKDFQILKIILKISEGDFMKFKPFETTEILKKEFKNIYSDATVNPSEVLLNCNLQFLFDLSYDEFEELKKDDIIQALLNGANPLNLDITKIPYKIRFFYLILKKISWNRTQK